MEKCFFLGFVELREVVHGHRAVVNIKHGCSFPLMQILKLKKMGKLEQSLGVMSYAKLTKVQLLLLKRVPFSQYGPIQGGN